MLGKLSEMFGPKGPDGAKSPRRSKVNLEKRFTLVSLTAQGSMSRVHRAIDNETGRPVCLKVQVVDKNAAAAARASKDEARPDEGEIGSRISDPHVVRTFDYGESTRGEHFVVMEFIEGVSLQYVREARASGLAQRIDMLIQAGEGLAAVHAAGFIHHDINPRNWMVNRDEQVKLIDFGLAVPNTPAFRKPGNRTGTLQYMAPELIRRESIDERIDIFSFGAVAFEFLTYKHPYESAPNNSLAMIMQRINHDPIDPAVAEPRLRPAVCDLLRKAIARRKDDRYSSMAELLNDLQTLAPNDRRLDVPDTSAMERTLLTNGPVDVGTRPQGGVYMLKAGPLYMIRKTSQFDRRLKQVMIQLSDKVEVVHTIPSWDPQRAEAFWRNRLHDKHHKGEWFKLDPEDVADFQSYTEMDFDD